MALGFYHTTLEEGKALVEKSGGIRLDIGCGENKQEGFIGLDKRPLKGVDIIHDLEIFPYPLPDECCFAIMGSHIVEHIKPWLMLEFMNELWRIMKPGGQLAFSMPYGTNTGYIQDPTHCNPCNEATFQYFDPRYPLYNVYKIKPWLNAKGFPIWHVEGTLEALLYKATEEEGGKYHRKMQKKFFGGKNGR